VLKPCSSHRSEKHFSLLYSREKKVILAVSLAYMAVFIARIWNSSLKMSLNLFWVKNKIK
jgi:hypothetical protein